MALLMNPHSLNSVKASELGCALNCVLEGQQAGYAIGSGGTVFATDDTSLIQAWLDARAAANAPYIYLYMDGPAKITGLKTRAGNVTIDGPADKSCGFYVSYGSNSEAISNGAPLGVPGTPPALSLDFCVQNLTINCNNFYTGGTNGVGGALGGLPSSNSSASDHRLSGIDAHWIVGIDIANVDGLVLRNLKLLNSPTFMVRMNNCTNISITDVHIDQRSMLGQQNSNTDGLHFDGPCSNIFVSNCWFSTADDAIALNAPEGYGGSISNVTMTNLVFANVGGAAVRMYTTLTTPYTISNVVIDNFVAYIPGAINCAFWLGVGSSPGAAQDAITQVKISNGVIRSHYGIAGLYDPCGVIDFENIVWIAPDLAGAGWLRFSSAVSHSAISIKDCSIYRNTVGSALVHLVDSSTTNATIGKLCIDGFSVDNEIGVSPGSTPYLIDMFHLLITLLDLKNVDTTNVAAIVNPTTGFTGITKMRGGTLKSLGYEVPDAIVANGCDFLSNVNHLPAINIAGVKKTYTVT